MEGGGEGGFGEVDGGRGGVGDGDRGLGLEEGVLGFDRVDLGAEGDGPDRVEGHLVDVVLDGEGVVR